MHGSSAGQLQSGSLAMPVVLGSSQSHSDNYAMGHMKPATQVKAHSNLAYCGQPLVSC